MDDFMEYRKKLEKNGLIYPKEEEAVSEWLVVQRIREWMYKLDKFARNNLRQALPSFEIDVECLRKDGSVQFSPGSLLRLAESIGSSVDASEWYKDSYRVLRLINDRGYDFWAVEYKKKEVDDVRDTNERQ